jgi:tetratricopeptide (TPR) repeat protein
LPAKAKPAERPEAPAAPRPTPNRPATEEKAKLAADSAKPAKPKAEEPPAAPSAKVEAKPAVNVPEGADATELQSSGRRKLEAGDLTGAIADLRASLQLRQSVQTQTLLGRAYFDHGDLAQAAKVLSAAGNHDEAMLLLGNVYQQQGKTAQARKTYEAFLKAHPDHRKAGWVRNLLTTL